MSLEYEILQNDKEIEFMLIETKSEKTASILKKVQLLKSGKDRLNTMKVIKMTILNNS